MIFILRIRSSSAAFFFLSCLIFHVIGRYSYANANANVNADSTTRSLPVVPSTPPAPLFQSTSDDCNCITVSMQLDPNDAIVRNAHVYHQDDDDDDDDEIEMYYTLQMEQRQRQQRRKSQDGNDDNDEIFSTIEEGVWVNVMNRDGQGIMKVESQSQSQPHPQQSQSQSQSSPGSNHFATATIFHLAVDMEYRFRVRVVMVTNRTIHVGGGEEDDDGDESISSSSSSSSSSSPWSSPSQIMRVPSTLTPHAPIHLSVVSKTSNSVHLSWEAAAVAITPFANSNANREHANDDDDNNNNHHNAAHWYHIQYRRQMMARVTYSELELELEETEGRRKIGMGDVGNGVDDDDDGDGDGDENPLAWVDHPMTISGISKFSIPEIQEVTTSWTLDENDADVILQTISRGYFRLKLEVVVGSKEDERYKHHHHHHHHHQLDSTKISAPIPFNATEGEFEHALKQIAGVTHVRVFRYQPNQWRRRMSIHPSSRGEYSWRVEFETEGSAGSMPLLEVVKDTLGSVGDGYLYGNPNVHVSVSRLHKGTPTSYEHHLDAFVQNLDPETYYEFRVRGENVHGTLGAWSEILSGIQTDVALASMTAFSQQQNHEHDGIHSKHTKKLVGNGRHPGNTDDRDYVSGAGMGGLPLEDGGDGMVVIISYDRKDMTMASRSFYYYTGDVQYFIVDENDDEIGFIDVKVWAGGSSGGGTDKSVSENDATNGVGGDCIKARLIAQPGEMFIIQVGSGGQGSPLDKDQVDHHNSNYKERFGSTTYDYETGIQQGGDSVIFRKNGKLLVSAGGGNGGNSFIDFSDVYVDVSKKELGQRRPRPPVISNITHSTFVVSWEVNAFDSKIGNAFEGFNIEMSSGREGAGSENGQCSDDFTVVDIIQVNGEYTFKRELRGLLPDTPYCIRLIGTGHHGVSKKSWSTSAVTLEKPKNRWWFVHSRDALKPQIKSGSICQTPAQPSPRRGHSMSYVNGKLYMFGGYTTACVCNDDEIENKLKCGDKIIYSNELWELDTFSNIWKLLLPNSYDTNVPIGREKHSASVLSNGKIAIIGGRSEEDSTEQGPLFLGDVWEFDPGQITSHVFTSKSEQVLVDGQISYHEILVNIPPRENYRSDDLCVRGLSVEVTIQHPCIEQLSFISLHGPDLQDSSFENQGDDAKLYMGPLGFNDCSEGNATISFSDSATRSVLDYSSTLPQSGSYIPAESIEGHYKGEKVDGIWTLAIHDKLKDDIAGKLVNWALHLEAEHCSSGGRWMELSSSSSNSCDKARITNGTLELQECPEEDSEEDHLDNSISGTFTPRHSQTAVPIGNDIFLLGKSIDGLKETWRFNYSSKTWTKLHGLYREKRWVGQAAALTPYGVVAFSGLRIDQDHTHFDKRLYYYNILTERRTQMSSISMEEDKGDPPQARYFSDITFIDKSHLIFDSTKIQDLRDVRRNSLLEPALLMFAGDMGLTDDDASFHSDQWFLTLNELRYTSGLEVEEQRDEACRHLLDPSRTDNNKWDWTCGSLADVNSENPCRFEDIILMAWCLEQYNSFTSPF